jgi:hypothetical protein
MQPVACAGAPIRDPLSGRVEGVLNLTCRRTDADPAMLTLVRQAVAGIEQRLLEQTAIVLPDGTVRFPDLPSGLPLGLGGLPFEPVETAARRQPDRPLHQRAHRAARP